MDDQHLSISRKYIVLAALSLPTLLLSVDTSVLYLAMPHLSKDLKADSAQQLWIMDSYSFMMAGFLIIMGNLGDRIGYRKLLIIGSAAFGLTSVIAAFSPNVAVLIMVRALMGIAGATLMPSTLALISITFTGPKERGTAISIWMSCFMAGMIIGPLAGGLVLEHFWWGAVFLLGVPVMMAIVFAGRILLPECKHQNTRPLNLAGGVLSLAAILPFIYGLTEMSRNNLHILQIAAVFIGLMTGFIFIKHEGVNPAPLVDLNFFRNRVFRITLTTMFFAAIIMGGMALFIAQYLQMVLCLPPFNAGLWMIPQGTGMIIGSMAVPVIARKIRQGLVISAGLFLSVIGMLLITLTPAVNGLILLETGFVIAIIGVSPILVLGTGIIISAAPAEKAGAAASMSETGNQLGIALGVALLGGIGIFVYRTTFVKHHPAAISKQMLLSASESIVHATSLSSGMDVKESIALLISAKGAFVNSLNYVAAICAFIFILLTLATGLGLRVIKQL
jgi:MFS transporter, DHA2 family, multidrug resistance protein